MDRCCITGHEIPDLMHTFVTCNGIKDLYREVEGMIGNVFNVSIKAEEMETLSLMDRNLMKMRLCCGLR